MSYYHNKRINDVFVINNVINPSLSDVYYLGKNSFIEIFNNEIMEFDLTDMVYTCSNVGVGGVELNKIKVNWGDGHVDVVTKGLKDKGKSINNKGQSWKRLRHLYNTDKRNVYLTDDIKSLSRIEIYLYNTYNDVTKLVIPYKLIYKTIYDMDCNFSIMSANFTNNNLTSYVLKENNTDSVTIVQSRDWKRKSLSTEDVVYVTDTTISTDYSNEFVNEDAIIWDWDSLPYIDISPTYGQYNGYQAITTTFTERTVPIESWTPYAYRILDSGDDRITNITKPQYSNNMFVIRGGTGTSPEDLPKGIYRIYVKLTGINDVTGNTDEIYKAVPATLNPSESILFNTTPSSSTNLSYNFTYKNTEQNKYIKSGKLILTPKKMDISDDMLANPDVNGDSSKFATADSYYKFEYDLQFPSSLSNREITRSIPLKSLPNGTYGVQYEIEDILGNKTKSNLNKNGVPMGDLKWKYTNIGGITCKDPSVMSVTKTENSQETWVNDIVQFKWDIDSPTEMDKVTLSIVHDSEVKQNGVVVAEVGDVYANLRQSVVTNSSNNLSNVWQPTVSGTTYAFTHNISPEKIPNGKYKVITTHSIEMLDYISERSVSSQKTWNYTYNAPKCTITSINPVMKLDTVNKRWNPVFQVSVNFKKDKLGSSTVSPNVDVTDVKLTALNGSDKSIIKDRIVPKQSMYEYTFDDIGWKYNDKSKTVKFSYTCRDQVDTIWKRTEVNPTKYIIKRNGTGFGAFITMLPKTEENVYNYKNYYKGNDKATYYSGVQLQNETSVDVYRLYANANRTLFSSVDSPKYFQKTVGDTDTDLYTYFTTTTYTDKDNPNYKFGRYSWSTTQSKQTLQELPSVNDYITTDQSKTSAYEGSGMLLLTETQEYNKSSDTTSIILDLKNNGASKPDVSDGKFVQERVMCAMLSYEKRNSSTQKYEEVIPPFDIRTNKLPIRVDNLELGEYRYKLKYSSVNTKNYKNNDTNDENTIYVSSADESTGLISSIPQNDVLTAQVSKTSFNDTLSSITFSWNLHHKGVTGLKLVWVEKNADGTTKTSKTVSLKNTDTYHNPAHYFTKGNTVQFYFVANSDYIKWDNADNKKIPSDYTTSTKHTFKV